MAVEVAELVQHLEMTGQGTGCLPLDLKINWGINFLLVSCLQDFIRGQLNVGEYFVSKSCYR